MLGWEIRCVKGNVRPCVSPEAEDGRATTSEVLLCSLAHDSHLTFRPMTRPLTTLGFAATVPLLLATTATDIATADTFGSVPGVAVRLPLKQDPAEWVSVYVALEGKPVIETLDLQQPLDAPANLERAQRQRDVLRKQHKYATAQVESLGGQVVADLSRLVNALQVRIPANRAHRLAELSDAVRVEPVPMYQRSLASAVPFVGAPEAWENLPATGAGIKVGIIDTGIDYLHADFGGSGNPDEYKNNDRTVIEPGTFPTSKVIGGYDFVGDAYNGTNTAEPDEDPLDCFEEESTAIAGGHGTHVAGIAAGIGVNLDGTPFDGSYLASLDPSMFRVYPGVAPDASLYALRIFGCDGSTNMVASAIDWAVDPNDDGDFSDHLDVVNLSLGGEYGLQTELEATQIRNATAAGVLLVVAAGNSGDVFFVTGEPATYTETLSVAASVDVLSYQALRIDAPAAVAGDVPCAEGVFTVPLAVAGPITGQLAATQPADACDTLLNSVELSGNVAFIDRGDCTFVDKVQRAYEAGAVAVVVADNVDQEAPFTMGGDGSQKPIPAVMIRLADAEPLRPYLSGGVTVTLDAHNLFAFDIASDQIASFSSRGPRSQDGMLKPDISAPGMSITSAGVGSGSYPRDMSGTSMACPMAAGAAAVLREAHPALSALEIKAMMMNTTAPLANGAGVPVPVSLGGAGRLRVADAAAQVVTATAAEPNGAVSLSFGRVATALTYSDTRDIVITNHGDTDQTFTTSASPTYELSGASVTVSPTTITVPANSTATISATLTIEPDQLPIEAIDPHTPAELIIRDEPYARQFVNEYGGHVLLSDSSHPPLRVPFYAIVRAADRHEADTAVTCIVGDDQPISVPLTGIGTHKEPVVSVFQHILSHPTDPLAKPIERINDLGEVGVANDLATMPFAEASLYFAISVAGDWTTPARGVMSLVGIAIDINGDQNQDYLTYAEPYSAFRFRDILRATTYRLSTGERVGRTDLNVVRRDDLNTELFNSNVVILPVPLAALSELTEDAASLSFFAFTQHLSVPMMRETTPWVTYDPTHAPIDTARDGHDGTPLYGPGEPIRVHLDEDVIGAGPRPSLLLLHHSNEMNMRTEVVSLEDVGVAYPSDLTVAQQAPSTMVATAEQSWTIQVENAGGADARDVAVALSVTNGATVTDMISEQGPCASATCHIDALAVGESATVTVTVQSGNGSFEATAEVSNAASCEVDETNNQSTAEIEVTGGTGSTGDGGISADVAEFTPGGGCSCRAATTTSSNAGWLLLGLAGLWGWRRRR
jgi:MYXO-CTERM domain-containing protein